MAKGKEKLLHTSSRTEVYVGMQLLRSRLGNQVVYLNHGTPSANSFSIIFSSSVKS